MKTIEIILIVGVCLSPIIAFMFVVPKLKKSVKKPPAKQVAEPKKEENKMFTNSGYSTDEFKNYLKDKNKNLAKQNTTENKEKPKNFNIPDEFKIPDDFKFPKGFRDDDEFDSPEIKSDENKSLAEEIDDLSPELKAMLIDGVLERKNFDDKDKV